MPLVSEVLHAIRASFAILLKEVASFYINSRRKSTTFHSRSVCQFSKQLPQKLYELLEQFGDLLNADYLGVLNEKLANFSDKGRSVR